MNGKMMKVNQYSVRISDENNRINSLIEECKFDIYGVPHIDLDMFVQDLLNEAFLKRDEAEDSGLPSYEYVLKYFGIA